MAPVPTKTAQEMEELQLLGYLMLDRASGATWGFHLCLLDGAGVVRY
jgi:hypothetical protein